MTAKVSGFRIDTSTKRRRDKKGGVIRIRISKKNKQHNDHKKKYKRTNNDLPNMHIKLKTK